VEAGHSDQYFTTAELIFNSINIMGDADKYPPPDYESLGIDLSSFSISIKHAFQAGQGKIIADQGAGSHFGGDDFALDLCEGSGCAQGTIGQYVIAPANMKLVASRDENGIDNDPLDFHFFELANDGKQRLCMSFAHFQIRLPGLIEGKSVPQGALIGTLIQYAEYSDIEHLHMGLYTVESSKPSCLHVPRTAVSFTNNLKLDGKEYPPNQNWKGEKVTSTNYPFCAAPYDIGQGQPENHYTVITDLSGCFGDDPPDDTTPPSANSFSASVVNGRTAEITTSGVQDNSGGSGVKEVRFSAKWAGNWYGIGTDSSAPYTLTWDMCSSSVSNGDVELGMEIWDNANNKWVWSEHYGNPHITKDSACGGSGDPQPGGEWHANFWMNKYLAGYVNWDVYYLWDDGKWPYIWFDWGINGPKEGWSGDEFSLRIWRNVYFPGGRYEFRTESDDGVRVYVDGQIVVDRWWDANSGAGGGKDISSGWHEVKVEYYENTGNARLYVYWYGPGYPQPDHENPGGRISSPIHLSAVNVSPLTIWAEAWDDASGVDFVRFMAHYCQGGQCGWHELGTDRNAPYNYSWDWSAAGEQHVWLAIHVADKTGKVTYDPGGWVEVDLDKTSPSAEIITPASGAYLTGNNVQISALASDSGSGVGSVQFFAGYADGSGEYWHDLGFDTNGSDGWNKSWDVSSVNDQRDVSFFVYAYDKANNYMGTATWATVLDRVPPTSAVQGLPATSPASFTVQWSGSDATSGVAGFDIDYQQDGGSWTRWRTGVTETSATFDGANGHTYGFRSRAIDMAGHVEAWPPSPDSLTTVSGGSTTTDIFWYAPGAARDYLHLSNGDGTFHSINQNIGGTYTPLISDFNGDEVDDIFWYAPGAAPDYLHLSNRDGTFRSVKWNIGGTYKPLLGDFNGDGAGDVFWYAPGAVRDYLHLSNGDGTFHSINQNIGGTYTPLVSDFNGDVADDIFWYARGAARDYLHLSNGDGTFRSINQNIGGTYTPLVSDFNGDGADDVFWYAPGAAPDYLHLSNWDGTFRSVGWNIGGTYTPLLGDFNGDGADDIFWYAPGVAPDYLHLSNRDGTFRSVKWNIGGTYKPLLGDFNGDEADDVFWYAPGAAPDYLHLSNRDGTFRSVGWNIGGTYTPLLGNYD